MQKRIQWHVEKRKLSELKAYDKNPRIITALGLDQLIMSFDEIGFAQPININLDNTILSGHARCQALKSEDANQVIDVYVPDRKLTPKQEEAVIIRMNKNVAGKWDYDILANEYELGDLIDYGFTEEELDLNLPEVEVLEPQTDEDEVPEVQPDPITRRGDVWLLGNHRVMCGDSTMIDDVEKLMNGEKADMVFTDPPYGMFLDANYDKMFSNDKSHRKTGDRFENVKGDHEDFNPDFINNIFGIFGYCREIFLWGADYYSEHLIDKNKGSWVVWDKRCNDQMDKVIGNTFELCWSKAKHKRMVARVMWSGHHGMAKDDTKKRVHPTQKPVELINWFFDYYSLKDKNKVVDLFLGSGSTLVACEKNNKQCYGMELDEKYCDVIINRWQNYTGKEATLESDGKTYDELKVAQDV